MTYYTDSNQIRDLMSDIAEVEMKPLHALETWTGVTVYLFDFLFEPLGKLPEYCWSVNTLSLLTFTKGDYKEICLKME